MTNYTIEKRIPIPSGHRETEFEFPLSEMSVGDSFLVLCKTIQERQRKYNRLMMQEVKMHRKKSGVYTFSVSTRSTADGFRVWRIS